MTEGVPRLSIVIPTYNGWRWLERCLVGVGRFRPEDSQVIVVDDGSPEPIAEWVRERFPWAEVVRLSANGGFCRAANAGLRACRAPIVQMLNNDTHVADAWWSAALDCFADPTVAVVAPLIYRMPFRSQIDSAGDHFYWYGLAKKRGEGKPISAPFDQPTEVFGASAAAAFYRRDALCSVGAFPEDFVAYLDDVDVGFRLRLAGFRCVFEPRSKVGHWVSRSHPHGRQSLHRQIARNSERVFWINLTAPQLAIHLAPHFVFVLIQWAYKIVRGGFGGWYAGRLSVLFEAPKIWAKRKWAHRLNRIAR